MYSLKHGNTVLLSVEKDEKCGVIDLEGKIIVPFEYDIIDFLENGESLLLDVKKDGKWGVIDLDEKIIVPFEHDSKIIDLYKESCPPKQYYAKR
jgi:hypothetical protein